MTIARESFAILTYSQCSIPVDTTLHINQQLKVALME